MCDTCGVTEAQYRRARWLLTQHSWATLYRNVSEVDPALMGIDEAEIAAATLAGC